MSVRADISDADLGYAAGFFDGEGCISIGKNGAIDIRITNTSISVLTKLMNIFGGSITNRTQKVNKKQYAYSLYGDNGIEFLKLLLPYLVEKQQQANTIIEYYSLRNELTPISIKGKRGRFSNPDREVLVNTFREILTEQKLEEQ
jgi:hypothetical protein